MSKLSPFRLGAFTSSEIHYLMGIKGLGKQGQSYVFKNVAECITGIQMDFETRATKYGTENEPNAVRDFVHTTLKDVIDCEYIALNEHEGSSPDRQLLWEPAYLETKCHSIHYKHVQYMEYDIRDLNKPYWWQMQHGLKVTDSEYWYFVSWLDTKENAVHPNANIYIKRIERNEADIKLLGDRIDEAIDIKLNMIERYRRGENICLQTQRDLAEIKDRELTGKLIQSIKSMEALNI